MYIGSLLTKGGWFFQDGEVLQSGNVLYYRSGAVLKTSLPSNFMLLEYFTTRESGRSCQVAYAAMHRMQLCTRLGQDVQATR